MNKKEIEKNFNIKTKQDFEKNALKVFSFQYKNNPVYKKFVDLLNVKTEKINSISQIPFLPVEFFKTKKIKTKNFREEIIFSSSGTQGNQSFHYVKDLNLYNKSIFKGFENYYGNIENYTILALLPSYLERKGSSLVYMIEKMIEKSSDKRSGFFLYNHLELFNILQELKQENKKVLFIGVSFGLLDFISKYKLELNDNFIVMETGGMKGKRREILREELHQEIKKKFNIRNIHSEYGMTELLSQSYSKKNGIFESPSWMKIMIRDINDPKNILKKYKIGIINIIDLANIYSCSFISTKDLGEDLGDNKFKVLGRVDNSDIRGCNLMITNL